MQSLMGNIRWIPGKVDRESALRGLALRVTTLEAYGGLRPRLMDSHVLDPLLHHHSVYVGRDSLDVVPRVWMQETE